MNVKFYLSYDIKNTLKSHFWRINVIILSLCTQCCYRRQNRSHKSVKHGVINFIARCIFTPRRDFT